MTAVAEEDVTRTLYQQLLDGWNRRSASDMLPGGRRRDADAAFV